MPFLTCSKSEYPLKIPTATTTTKKQVTMLISLCPLREVLLVIINTRSLIQQFSFTSHDLCTTLNEVTFDALIDFNENGLP